VSLHLVPAGDVDAHELHVACPCLPRFWRGERPDGTYGQVVDHTGVEPEQPQREE
jgi:hypothetical protein